jgi:hypothetical protein
LSRIPTHQMGMKNILHNHSYYSYSTSICTYKTRYISL